MKLTKRATQKFQYKIKVTNENDHVKVLELIDKMRALDTHDVTSVEMNVSGKGSKILINSNQNVSVKYGMVE